MKQVTLTAKETAITLSILINELNSANYGLPLSASECQTWSKCIDMSPFFPEGMKLTSVGGVVASLAKKGIASTSCDDCPADERTTGLTEAGYEVAVKLWAEAAEQEDVKYYYDHALELQAKYAEKGELSHWEKDTAEGLPIIIEALGKKITENEPETETEEKENPTMEAETKKVVKSLQDGIRHALKKNDEGGIFSAQHKLAQLKALLGEDDDKFLKQEAKVLAAVEAWNAAHPETDEPEADTEEPEASPLEKELEEEGKKPAAPKADKSRSEIIQTIQKLMAVASGVGSSEKEIETSLKKARKLMLKHQIAEGDLEENVSNIIEDTIISRSSRWDKAVGNLAFDIARLFGCNVYRTNAPKAWTMKIVGRKEMVEAALEVFKPVWKTMTKVASSETKNYAEWTSYSLGYENAINERVTNMVKPRGTEEKALVKAMDSELVSYMEQLNLTAGKSSKTSVNLAFYARGQEDGKKADLSTKKVKGKKGTDTDIAS